jgi:hypothetical protein
MEEKLALLFIGGLDSIYFIETKDNNVWMNKVLGSFLKESMMVMLWFILMKVRWRCCVDSFKR